MNLLTSEQLNKLKSILETLSTHQLIWVSGYIWGIINSSNNVSDKQSVCISKEILSQYSKTGLKKRIFIIYASQTGNAKTVAQQLYDDFIKANLNVVLFNVGEYKYKKFSEIKLLIFITSTHGEGEPPETAITLYRYLFSKKSPRMDGVGFVVLGLGDRSYNNFAKAGKDFDKRFEELGAHRLYKRVDVDVDYRNDVNLWRDKMVSLFKEHSVIPVISDKYMMYNKKNDTSTNNILISNANVVYSKECPYTSRLLSKQKITSRYSLKDIHHLELDITGSNLYYKPGDALGIWYKNDYNLVNELLNLLNINGDTLIDVQHRSICLYEALEKHYELTQNTAIVVENLARFTKNQLLLNLLLDKKKLNNFLEKTPIVEMIRQISCKLDSSNLLSILRPMKPRFYSISSAQVEVEEEIHITVNVIRYTFNGRLRSGGASSYLVDRLKENDEVRIFIEPNDNFRLPEDLNASVIMIGAGTGIAPFRAFIQQRAYDNAKGKNWLFFGNLKFIDDFLYQTEWQYYMKEGILNKIDTAWSRDQDHKVYVQDKLLKNGFEVWSWIQEGAHVYVCGSAKYMANDVEYALIQLTSEHGDMNNDQSINFWDEMRIKRRYQRDIY